jgi:Xaa-Pro aminopeptidase
VIRKNSVRKTVRISQDTAASAQAQPVSEIAQRRHDVAARFAELKLDAFLVTSSANVRYLSGFSGSNGMVVLTPSETHFFTDPRYALVASQTIEGTVHVVKGPMLAGITKVIQRKKLKHIGFESSWCTYEQFEKLKDQLPLGASLVPVGRVIEERRMLKSPAELAHIRRSVAINSKAFERAMKTVKPGMQEVELAAEIDFQQKAFGAEGSSFDTIVAAGVRSALPHAHPSHERLRENELLLIDMGSRYEGYASDMTRVVHIGRPAKQIRDMYKAVLEAQLAGINAVRAGVTAGKVDAATRKVLKAQGLEHAFIHSTGHGLGLEIHESPRLGKKDQTVLKAGMAITIEPGVYLAGLGGIRIEDTVVVTETGCEVLTPTSKEFVQF